MEKRLIMGMKYLVIVILLTVTSCQSRLSLEGEWKYIKESNCDVNPLGFFVDSAPINEFGHKVYFTIDSIYNPSLMRADKLPFNSQYHLKKNQLVIEDLGKFECEVNNDTLHIMTNECIMTFVAIKNNPLLYYNKIKFLRKNDNGHIIDSLEIDSNKYIDRIIGQEVEGDFEYLLRLSNLINFENESYGQKSNDVDCYWIDLINDSGKVNKIHSCGNLEVPIEIRTLIRYINNLRS